MSPEDAAVHLLGARDLRALMERHGLDARRSLGQNFVADPGVVTRIAAEAGVGPGDRVVEVGPGLGSLTLALVRTGARVLAVEKDPALARLLPAVLAEAGADPVPEVVADDALTLDWGALLGEGSWSLVANLPYNVAVPIVIGVLQRAPMVHELVVMVQREVADRLCASPGGRTIGVPTVKVAWYAAARRVMTVPPEVFVPRPRVDSAVVRLARRPPPRTDVDPGAVFALVDLAYRQRRKMLRSTLHGRVGSEAFAAAGIPPTARPEELDVGQWAALAAAVPA